MSRKTDARPNIYARITDQIIAALERGVKPWTQPWAAGHAAGPVSKPLRYNGEAYSGINILTLWATATERGHAAPLWMTYRQAQELGGQVRKGERGAPVVYANTLLRSETDERTGEDTERAIPFLKSYTVFNVEQIDGLPTHYYAPASTHLNPDDRDAAAEAFFAGLGAEIRHGGGSAFYRMADDRIQLPPFETFLSAERYYATLAHEGVHWTRHPRRLDRSFDQKRFGDAGYAREELVAELGAAFLCADLGLALEDREDHAAYIEHWLGVLREDNRAIFTAAAHAQKAADYMHGLQAAEQISVA